MISLGALYILHQDFWFWRTAQPLAFGFIPIGLAYHAAFTLVTALVLGVLVKYAWPAQLEAEIERLDSAPGERAQPQAQEGQAN